MGMYSNEHTNRWMNNRLNRKSPFRGIHVEEVVREENEKNKKKSFKEQLISQDGKIRMEIHYMIEKMVADGKTTEEIIESLYTQPKFQKFSDNFHGWIIDQQNKYEQSFKKEASVTITKMLQEGSLIKDILNELNKIERYQRFTDHFQDWIEEYYQKMIKTYRQKIVPFISNRLSKGKSTQEILEDLSKRPEYKVYETFYPSWIKQLQNPTSELHQSLVDKEEK